MLAEITLVEREPQRKAVERLSDSGLGSRIPGPDPRHHVAPVLE